MPKRRYIKLYPEITAHPVFKNPAALQVFIYLLTQADWQTGECQASARQIAGDCGKCTDAPSNIMKILAMLEKFESIEFITRKPLKIRIPNWKKWQASEGAKGVLQITQPCVTDNTPCVTDNTPCVTDNTPCVIDNTPCVTDNTPDPPLPYKDSARARDISNTSNTYNKEFLEREEEKKNFNEKREEEFFHLPFNPRTEDYGYPQTPADIIQEATRQCLKMTQEQAQAFLDYYRSLGWTVKGSHIPPNGWKFKIRRWLDYDAERMKTRAGAPSGNPNAIRAGYSIEGVAPPTEDFK